VRRGRGARREAGVAGVSVPTGYVVVRFPSRWLGLGLVPPGLEGRWFEVPDPRMVNPAWGGPGAVGWVGDDEHGPGTAVARPTGTFETREDGAVAEVWRVEELVEP